MDRMLFNSHDEPGLVVGALGRLPHCQNVRMDGEATGCENKLSLAGGGYLQNGAAPHGAHRPLRSATTVWSVTSMTSLRASTGLPLKHCPPPLT